MLRLPSTASHGRAYPRMHVWTAVQGRGSLQHSFSLASSDLLPVSSSAINTYLLEQEAQWRDPLPTPQTFLSASSDSLLVTFSVVTATAIPS